MIRIFKLVLLLVCSQVAFAQAPSNYTNINGRYRWIAGMFDSTFHIPKGTSPSLRTGGSTNSGGLFYNTTDSSVYTYTGTQWIKLRGSLNASDTANRYITQVYKKNGSDSIFYIKGGTHTWAFNDSTGGAGGGGGGKVYYFNGGVNMGTFGGLTMYELGDTAVTSGAANFTRATTGSLASFITDPGKPGLLQIPAGAWTIDAWLSETGGGSNSAQIWVEVEKWDGSTITTIATSPIEEITQGSTPDLYTWSVSIPTTSLLVTDRIIIQFYITNTNGKTVTLYTQNGYVGEVHTTFTTGIGALNGLTAPAQYLVTGTSGTDFNISSVTATHTFNLPTASATNRGALSSSDWTTFNNKIGGSGTTNYVSKFTASGTIGNSLVFDNGTSVGINTVNPTGSGLEVFNDAVGGRLRLTRDAGTTKGAIQFGRNNSGSFQETARINATADNASQNNGSMTFQTSDGSGSLQINMTMESDGNVSVANKIGVGTLTQDSALTVAQGTHLQRGVRMSGLPSAVGTKSLRIDASGTLSIADTLASGVSGTGTANRVSKFTSSGVIGNSSIVDSSSSVAMTISSAGNIGLGITPSSWNIGSGSSYKALQFSNGVLNSFTGLNEQMNLGLNWYYDNGDKYYANGAASIYQQSNGDHYWYTAPSGTANNTVTFTNRMSLYNDGKLHIGAVVSDSLFAVKEGVQFFRGVRLSGLPTAPGTKALRINANGTLSVSDTLANGISGSGTTNYIPKFTSSSAIGNSNAQDNGTTFDVAIKGKFTGTSGSDILTLSAPTNGGKLTFAVGSSTTGSLGSALAVFGSGVATDLGITAESSSKLIFGTNNQTRMTLDASGNLGLGTSNPAANLQVAAASAPTIAMNLTGSITSGTRGDLAWYNSAISTVASIRATAVTDNVGTQLEFYTRPAAGSLTQAMTLDASGRLGIGTTNPNYLLELNSTTSSKLSLNGGTSQNGIRFEAITGVNAFYLFNGTLDTGGFGIYDNTNSAARLWVNNSGNVGIGTTSPTQGKLVVSGSVVNSIMNVAGSFNAGNNALNIGDDGTNAAIGVGNSGTDMVFLKRVAGVYSEAMRITSGGEVFIGSSTGIYGGGSTNESDLLVVGAPPSNDVDRGLVSFMDNRAYNTSGLGAKIMMGGKYNNAGAITFFAGLAGLKENTTDGNYAGALAFYTRTDGAASSERMRITSGGEVYIGNNPADQGAYNLQVNGTGVWGAGAYVNGSDSVLKYNIQPLESSLEVVKQMKPVTFEYQPFYSKDTTTQTGFIAQDLQRLLADKVYKNGIVKEGGAYLGVAYENIIPLLVKSIQELEAQVQALKTQLNNR